MLAIFSRASDGGFDLPFTIKITDAENDTVSYSMSEDRRISSHQGPPKMLIYPSNVVLTDRTGRILRAEIQQPERTQ
jgi:hypothetical protein